MKDRFTKQRGVVLITSLILLLVMTMIGVSAIRGSALEERMSANDMNHNIVFQAAESAVEVAIDDINNLVSALNGNQVSVNVTLPGVSSSVAEVQYLTKGAALGYEIGDDNSFANYYFDVRGTGAINEVGAQTTTSHGIYVLGPDG